MSRSKKNKVLMDNIPDQLIWDIFSRIDETNDRDSLSLACRRFYSLDNENRKHLRVGCGLDPANETLTSLCRRFPNLNEIKVTYSRWTSESGKQLEDSGLSILPSICPFLTDLTLSHCTSITDAGLSSLASCSGLSSLRLNVIPGIMGSGLVSIISGCKNFKRLHIFGCSNISDYEWIWLLGWHGTVHDLCIKNCKGITEGHLVICLGLWQSITSLQFEPHPEDIFSSYDKIFAIIWEIRQVPCKNMVELSLTNCMKSGLACLLNRCKKLEKIHTT